MSRKSLENQVAQWVEEHSEYLFNYALRHFPDDDTAQDLVQESLLAAVEGYERFKGDSSPRTWLTAILRFKIIDRIRSTSRERPGKEIDRAEEPLGTYFNDVEHWHNETGPLPWNVDPENVATQKQFMVALEGCLQKLQPRYRQIFLLREVDEFEQEEICNKLEVSPTNLRAILCRTRIQLRECLHKNWFTQLGSRSREAPL